MLTEADELTVAWRALAESRSADGWVTVALSGGAGRVRAGIAFPAGEEMLLVGFNLAALPTKSQLPEGAGFRVEIAGGAVGPKFRHWICLARQAGAGRDLFLQMAADVMACVAGAEARGEQGVFSLMIARIRAWQEFMRRPVNDVLSPAEETGLAGELMMILRLVEAGARPGAVIAAWLGPANGLQDFQTGLMALEVKSTLQVAGFPAQVTSLEQLDDVGGKQVFLAALRFCIQENGATLPDLVSMVRALPGADRNAAAQLERSLLLAGFVDSAVESYTRKFHCVEMRIIPVSHGFPRIARSTTLPEIRSATYVVDLDLVTTPPINLSAILPEFGL